MPQGKLRIGLAEQTVLVALAHAVLLQRDVGNAKKAADAGLANRLEEASQSVKQAYSQCPSYDDLIGTLLEHGLEVRPLLPRESERLAKLGQEIDETDAGHFWNFECMKPF